MTWRVATMGLLHPGLTQGVAGALLGDPDTAVYFPGAGGVFVPYSADLNPFSAFSVGVLGQTGPERRRHRARALCLPRLRQRLGLRLLPLRQRQ